MFNVPAAARQASLRSVPRQPNPQGKEQHQENCRSSLPSAFSPCCTLIKGTRLVSEMLARRGTSLPYYHLPTCVQTDQMKHRLTQIDTQSVDFHEMPPCPALYNF